MSELKCILFDCMETVVDVFKLPDIRMYAWFAYNGCGHEDLWESFDAFVQEYNVAKNEMDKGRAKHEEYNLFDRFSFMVMQKLKEKDKVEKVVAAISNNYWCNYMANCYVDIDVKAALADMHSRYRTGIVSNFMVDGGIEELLAIHEIDRYFDFVVTSIKVGWRKPHWGIYDVALKLSEVSKDQILFVGDDYVCDYVGAIDFGFKAILLDKKNGRSELATNVEKVQSLRELSV
jgi:putative hydrolase of the HAD superfamily